MNIETFKKNLRMKFEAILAMDIPLARKAFYLHQIKQNAKCLDLEFLVAKNDKFEQDYKKNQIKKTEIDKKIHEYEEQIVIHNMAIRQFQQDLCKLNPYIMPYGVYLQIRNQLLSYIQYYYQMIDTIENDKKRLVELQNSVLSELKEQCDSNDVKKIIKVEYNKAMDELFANVKPIPEDELTVIKISNHEFQENISKYQLENTVKPVKSSMNYFWTFKGMSLKYSKEFDVRHMMDIQFGSNSLEGTLLVLEGDRIEKIQLEYISEKLRHSREKLLVYAGTNISYESELAPENIISSVNDKLGIPQEITISSKQDDTSSQEVHLEFVTRSIIANRKKCWKYADTNQNYTEETNFKIIKINVDPVTGLISTIDIKGKKKGDPSISLSPIFPKSVGNSRKRKALEADKKTVENENKHNKTSAYRPGSPVLHAAPIVIPIDKTSELIDLPDDLIQYFPQQEFDL